MIEVVDVVVQRLTPFIGANMARAAVRGQCEKLKLPARISPEDGERLLEALSPGLCVFIGRDRTAEILGEIRAALAGGPK